MHIYLMLKYSNMTNGGKKNVAKVSIIINQKCLVQLFSQCKHLSAGTCPGEIPALT